MNRISFLKPSHLGSHLSSIIIMQTLKSYSSPSLNFPPSLLLVLVGKGVLKITEGTSLAVHWLRLHLPMEGVQVRSLVRELRSHKPHGQKKQNRKQKQYYKLLLGEARPGRGLNRSRASMHGDGIRRDPAASRFRPGC